MERSREWSEGEAPGNRRSGPGLSILSGISGAARPSFVLLPPRTHRPPTPLGRKPGLSTGSPFARGRGAGRVLAPGPDALGGTPRGRRGVREAGSEKRSTRGFSPLDSAPRVSLLLGSLGTALRARVVGSEVFTTLFLISNNRQIPPMRFCRRHLLQQKFQTSSAQASLSPDDLQPTLPSKSSLQRQGLEALLQARNSPPLSQAPSDNGFSCKVPRSRANENVRGKVLVLSLLLLKQSCRKNNQKISNNQEIC